jgi:transposase
VGFWGGRAVTHLTDLTHESLEVGAAPVVQHFLRRLQLQTFFERFLPPAPTGAPEKLSCATTLTALVGHLLLCRRPLYGLLDWFGRRVPEHLGLQPADTRLLNDDRIGRALQCLFEADGASLLTALVMHVVRAFAIEMKRFHNDSTSITATGRYPHQPDPAREDRAPLLARGHNKDHRPDLKQLLYCVSVSADGAVPIHFRTYDGNTADDVTHQETWTFLRQLVGHGDFLYVADCKLCSRDNLKFIAGKHGRFLTIVPRTRKEIEWMHTYVQEHAVDWKVVRRQSKERGASKEEVVYEAFEYPQRCVDGYRLLWYRSSAKRAEDKAQRVARLEKFRAWQRKFQARPKGRRFVGEEQALAKGRQVVEQYHVSAWVMPRAEKHVQVRDQQVGRGRPGASTRYERREETEYELVFDEIPATIAAAENYDGLFCLISNDEQLTLADALTHYKYQPFLEKRFEQLKTVFEVTPLWLKDPERIAGLLFVYYIVLLVESLIEREVRQRMQAQKLTSLPLYPEGRPSKAPTTELVLAAFEGHRRHRLFDPDGQLMRTFHDPLSDGARQLLALLEIEPASFGEPQR